MTKEERQVVDELLSQLPPLADDPDGVKAQRIVFDWFFTVPGEDGTNNVDAPKLQALLDWTAKTAKFLRLRASLQKASTQTQTDIEQLAGRISWLSSTNKANAGNTESLTQLVALPLITGQWEYVPDGVDGNKAPGIANGTTQTTSTFGDTYRFAHLLQVEQQVWEELLRGLAEDLVKSDDSLLDRIYGTVAEYAVPIGVGLGGFVLLRSLVRRRRR